MIEIKIDMNNPDFQRDFFHLEKNEQVALINSLKKIRQLSWNKLYTDNGLKWEVILSKTTSSGHRIYSFRFSQKYRATAFREGDFLRLLSLHTDHDSTYK
ncbi:MAG: hypothetical protein EPO11_05650 [Gammaproteobacteria bacterium]|nr:MAG: hypothetical protein EPO11_05650 [Gammaproteobacteria bacterium]